MPVKKIKAKSSVGGSLPKKPRFLPPRPLQVETQTSVATTPAIALGVTMICVTLIGLAFGASMMNAAGSLWKFNKGDFGYEIHDFAGVGDYGMIGNMKSAANQIVCFDRAKRGLTPYSSAPIVIVKSLSDNSSIPAQPLVYDIDVNCFKIKIQVWPGQDETYLNHKESVSFLVLPAGEYTLSGLRVKAGTVDGTPAWQDVANLNSDQYKVLFAQAQNNTLGQILQVERIRKNQSIPTDPAKTEVINKDPELLANGQDNLSSNFCVDGDNGKSPFASAAIIATNSTNDYDSCNGAVLKEKYCKINSSGKYSIGTEDVICPGGCQFGACVNTNPTVWQVSTQREKANVVASKPKKIGFIAFGWDGSSGFNGMVGNSQLQIGSFNAGSSWQLVRFASNFDLAPTLLVDMNTTNEIDGAGVRVKNLFNNSFFARVQEETATSIHKSENLVYLAIQRPKKEIKVSIDSAGVANDIVENTQKNLVANIVVDNSSNIERMTLNKLSFSQENYYFPRSDGNPILLVKAYYIADDQGKIISSSTSSNLNLTINPGEIKKLKLLVDTGNFSTFVGCTIKDNKPTGNCKELEDFDDTGTNGALKVDWNFQMRQSTNYEIKDSFGSQVSVNVDKDNYRSKQINVRNAQ
jgi:hypothetical protein